MKRIAVLLVALALLFLGCGGSSFGAEITSVKYEESINAGGVLYRYESQDIIRIVLNFKFDDSLTSGLDQTSDDYRKELFAILVEGAHFYYDEQEVQRTYGYWPNEAGSNQAKEMSLFYLVPSNHSVQDLRFMYDGSVLGEGASRIDTNINPK